jgi:hypothetical protein
MVDLNGLQQQAQYAAGAARQALAEAQAVKGGHNVLMQQLQSQAQQLQDLRNALSRVNVQAQSGDPNIQRVENIPGRRIPYDFLVEIPFVAGNAAVQQAIITIDQSGPFIAVARTASFVSTYQFQLQQNGVTAVLNGRSYGRCRPIHSAMDLNDGQPFSEVTQAVAFPGTGSPHIASPSNQSPFRSMEMDFRIEMQEQGSSIRRQNIPMLSSLWVTSRGDAFELGALDFFERSQVISFNVQPLHVPNPEFGNISAFTGGGSEWPFAGSGWDAIEGINDEVDGDPDSDPVTRLPSGVLQIGFHGYRIMQPPGPGQF